MSICMGGLTDVFSTCAKSLLDAEIVASEEGRAFHSVLFGVDILCETL